MSSDLKKLYSEIIKAHNDAPFHFEQKINAGAVINAYNPICGDRFELYVDHDESRVNQMHFHGYGCAISKASSSVLVKTIVGCTFKDALGVCENFLRFIDQKLKDTEPLLFNDFQAFSGVHNFPERYDCAALSWREMKKFLETLKSGK